MVTTFLIMTQIPLECNRERPTPLRFLESLTISLGHKMTTGCLVNSFWVRRYVEEQDFDFP